MNTCFIQDSPAPVNCVSYWGKKIEGNTGSNDGTVIIGSRSVTLWKVSSLVNEAGVWTVIFFSSWVGWVKEIWCLLTLNHVGDSSYEYSTDCHVLLVPEKRKARISAAHRDPSADRSREKQETLPIPICWTSKIQSWYLETALTFSAIS